MINKASWLDPATAVSQALACNDENVFGVGNFGLSIANASRPLLRSRVIVSLLLLSCVLAEGFAQTHLKNPFGEILPIEAETLLRLIQGGTSMWKIFLSGLVGCG